MKQFLKANVATLLASFFDYLTTIALKEKLHWDAVAASITGTVAGGIINFLICRHWAFATAGSSAWRQSKRYFFTWAGNLLLNAAGVYLLIHFARMNYLLAKIITSITVAIAYNYPMQKKYVFKKII